MTRKSMTEPWVLGQALVFVRQLGKQLKQAGFAVSLSGSVLHQGHSKKDLDIVINPHCKPASAADWKRVHNALFEFGLTQIRDRATVTAGWRKREYDPNRDDAKWVEEWAYGKHRVDVFFLE